MPNSNATKILLTGATGFVGSNLLEHLIDRNYEVIILTRPESDLTRIAHLNKFTVFCLDANNTLHDLFKEHIISAVIHLATVQKNKDSNHLTPMLESNIMFPTELLQIAAAYNVKAFINTGSFSEYDCTCQSVSEKTKLSPLNVYASTKIQFEYTLSTFSDRLKTSTLRLFSPYGENDGEKVIPLMIKSTLQQKPIQLYSDGYQALDFIYCEDVVEAYICLLEYQLSKNASKGHEIYNLGAGKAYSIREVLEYIEQIIGTKGFVNWGDEKPLQSMKRVYADISKISQKLQWHPKYDIRDGLIRTIKFYEKQGRNT